MAGAKLEIQPVSVGEIDDFARRTAADRQRIGNVPISRWRAKAWRSNPCAQDHDVALLVAWYGERCIGYFGLLPGQLQVGAAIETVNWSSTFYVEQEYKHTCAAIVLLQEVTRLGRHLFLTGFSPPVGELYRAMGFRPLGPLSYLELELSRVNPLGARLRSRRAARKKHGATRTPGLDRLVFGADWLFKQAAYPPLRIGPARLLRQIETRPLDRVPDGSPDAEAPPADVVRFVRGTDVVNWMLAEPWYTTNREDATEDYYFGDWYPVHKHLALEIRGKGEEAPQGWAVLRLHGSRRHVGLTVCDYHLADDDLGYLAALAIRHAAGALADSVTLPEACADAVARWRLPARLVRRRQRDYYWHPKSGDTDVEEISRAVQLALVDGDMAF